MADEAIYDGAGRSPTDKNPGMSMLSRPGQMWGGYPTERDPNGYSPNEAGAKVDAGKVELSLITGGMARALYAVADVATFGAAKYSRGGWVAVPDGFYRYENAQQRHASDRHRGETHDRESKRLHLAHEAWNALAKLDLYLRKQEEVNKGPLCIS